MPAMIAIVFCIEGGRDAQYGGYLGLRMVEPVQLRNDRLGGEVDNHASPLHPSSISISAAERFAYSRRACQCTKLQYACRRHAAVSENRSSAEYPLREMHDSASVRRVRACRGKHKDNHAHLLVLRVVVYGCSLMYLSLDPVLCDTTVDECDC